MQIELRKQVTNKGNNKCMANYLNAHERVILIILAQRCIQVHFVLTLET